MPGDNCVNHTDHENRIRRLEAGMDKLFERVGSPAVTVAVIGVFGTFFSGLCAMVGVIVAPAVRAWLGM